MIKYNVRKHIDYITASVIKFAPIDDIIGIAKARKPTIANYKEAIQFNCGIIVQWDREQPRMKTHITLSGETLSNLRAYGFTDVNILSWLSSLKGIKYGRIDIAITSSRVDGKKHQLTPQKVFKLAKRGKMKARIELDNPVVDTELKVETCYVGNRETRNRLLRAYDYNLAHDSGAADYVARYELESRSAALSIARRVIAGQDMGGIMRSVIDFPNNPVWARIMDSEPLPNIREDNHMTLSEREAYENQARWEWLLHSVAPALGKALAIDIKTGVVSPMDAFNELVKKYRNDYLEDTNNQKFDND